MRDGVRSEKVCCRPAPRQPTHIVLLLPAPLALPVLDRHRGSNGCVCVCDGQLTEPASHPLPLLPHDPVSSARCAGIAGSRRRPAPIAIGYLLSPGGPGAPRRSRSDACLWSTCASDACSCAHAGAFTSGQDLWRILPSPHTLPLVGQHRKRLQAARAMLTLVRERRTRRM